MEETTREYDEMTEVYYQDSRPAGATCGGQLGVSTIQQGPVEYHHGCFAG
jgi:hypothetical protein